MGGSGGEGREGQNTGVLLIHSFIHQTAFEPQSHAGFGETEGRLRKLFCFAELTVKWGDGH